MESRSTSVPMGKRSGGRCMAPSYDTWPVNSFVKPFGKIGVRWWDDEIDATARYRFSDRDMSLSPPSDHDNGFGLLFGVGAEMPMTESASFRVEYLYLPLGDDHGGDEHRAHAAVRYTF